LRQVAVGPIGTVGYGYNRRSFNLIALAKKLTGPSGGYHDVAASRVQALDDLSLDRRGPGQERMERGDQRSLDHLQEVENRFSHLRSPDPVLVLDQHQVMVRKSVHGPVHRERFGRNDAGDDLWPVRVRAGAVGQLDYIKTPGSATILRNRRTEGCCEGGQPAHRGWVGADKGNGGLGCRLRVHHRHDLVSCAQGTNMTLTAQGIGLS
jgi:hypothetical protein